jgi:hypothetical protein
LGFNKGSKLDAMLNSIWRQLMENPDHGVMAQVNHIAVRMENRD